MNAASMNSVLCSIKEVVSEILSSLLFNSKALLIGYAALFYFLNTIIACRMKIGKKSKKNNKIN